jgi:hypothetical protein
MFAQSGLELGNRLLKLVLFTSTDNFSTQGADTIL